VCFWISTFPRWVDCWWIWSGWRRTAVQWLDRCLTFISFPVFYALSFLLCHPVMNVLHAIYMYNSFRKEKSLTSNWAFNRFSTLCFLSLWHVYTIFSSMSLFSHKDECSLLYIVLSTKCMTPIYFGGRIHQCFPISYLRNYRTNVDESQSKRIRRARWRLWRQVHEMGTGFSTRIHRAL
jgi:hypothetical protein